MKSNKLELRPLRVEDEASFVHAIEEFKNETPPWEFAFHFDPAADFSAYVNKLENWSRGLELIGNFVPNSYFVGVVEGVIVRRLSLRHHLNDFLSRIGGHIGYGVIPSQRRRGYATAMLTQALPVCVGLGIQRVLVTCDVGNTASQRVIEKCGGVFEAVTDDPDLRFKNGATGFVPVRSRRARRDRV